MSALECDVLIVGCGPTGVVLANLLGALGARVAVLERDAAVYPIPRATHIDEETLRNFQATGLMSALEVHTAPFGAVDVVDEDGAVLLADEVIDRAAPHGYRGSRFFDQPAFERILREGLGRYPRVSLHVGVEADGFEDRGDAVTVRARRAATGEALTFRAAWVVGCDGGRSPTRAALDIGMESVAPKRHWLIVDALLRDPADASRLPGNFRYVLDPERLTIYAHGFGPNRRWEFQLAEGEAVPDEATVRRWLGRYIDPARLEVVRIVPYAHHSLIASRWRVGRVFVAGDAAHMMPPSAGQGMCSGVRDAVNLAWKLHRVLAGEAREALLDTYERERRPHVRDILEGTLRIGSRLEARTAFQRWRRRNELKLITNLPAGLQNIIRQQSVRRPTLREGFLDGASRGRGDHLPQAQAWRGGARHASDDLLGYRFTLLAKAPALETHDVEWARERGVALGRLGADVEEVDGTLARWMREQDLDFALVRPDRIIFGAGAARELPGVRASFDRWLR